MNKSAILLGFLAASCTIKTDPVLGEADAVESASADAGDPQDEGPLRIEDLGGAGGAGGAGGGGGLQPEVDATFDTLDAAPDGGMVLADASPDASPPPGDVVYRPCRPGERVGGFTASLEDGYTAVQGQVLNGVNPGAVEVEVATEGTCRLLQPPSHFCEPACAVGTTCGPDGCVPLPTAVSVGDVTVDGLLAPVALTAGPPVFFYTFRGNLPHPGFEGGAGLSLSAAGVAPVEAFSLVGQGVVNLVPEADAVGLALGQPVSLRWAPPAGETAARVRIDLNIANHGGTPARIECIAPDTGAFDLPVALTDQLLGLGASGFPRVILVRETVDSAATAVGCVDFRVQSAAVLDVTIPGLISCSFDEDCPMGQICRPDLTCGED